MNHDDTYDGRDKRKRLYTNSKFFHPGVIVTIVFALVSATITGSFFIGDIIKNVEAAETASLNRHNTAMSAIRNEAALRVLISENINENVDELKEDIKAYNEDMKERDAKTQDMLRQLLQQRSDS